MITLLFSLITKPFLPLSPSPPVAHYVTQEGGIFAPDA